MYQSHEDVQKRAEVIFDIVVNVEGIYHTFLGHIYISNERNFGVI